VNLEAFKFVSLLIFLHRVWTIFSLHSCPFIFFHLAHFPLPTSHYCDSFLLGGGAAAGRGSHGLGFPFPTPEFWASHFPLPIKEAPANFVQVVFEAVDSFVMKKKNLKIIKIILAISDNILILIYKFNY